MKTPYLTATQREERRVASAAIVRALRDGALVRLPCEVCARPNTHAHHRWGYSDPLRVAWLCAMHHAEEHAAMYRAAVLGPYVTPTYWTYGTRTSPKRLRAHLERIALLLADRERELAA